MSEKILRHHLQSQAILYVRQSTVHQVLHNRESVKLQYAMRDRLKEEYWPQVCDAVRPSRWAVRVDVDGTAPLQAIRTVSSHRHIARELTFMLVDVARWPPQRTRLRPSVSHSFSHSGARQRSQAGKRCSGFVAGVPSRVTPNPHEFRTRPLATTAGTPGHQYPVGVAVVIPAGTTRIDLGEAYAEPVNDFETLLIAIY